MSSTIAKSAHGPHLGQSPAEPRPHTLHRSLKLRHLVFLGVAYMAPLAVFDTFGLVSAQTGGHVPAAYLLVGIAVLLTALSYAKMVRLFPRAGSAYTYASETISPHLGFMVGWSATLDYLFLPMINALLSSIYMSVAFPAVPGWVWVFATIASCTFLNLIGVKVAAKVNVALVVIQIVVAAAFFILTIKNIALGSGVEAFTLTPFYSQDLDLPMLAGGASVLALSFLGFDAVSSMAEEAERPKRDIPRAIMILVLSATVFFVAISYTMQVLFPDVSIVEDIVSASPEIARHIGGAAFQATFIGGYMMAVLGCGLTQQMSAARLIFAMGRDGLLPRRFFGKLNRSGVPHLNVLLIALVACTALFLDLSSAASLINFGAYVAFMAVNLCVIISYFRFKKERTFRSVLAWVLLPGIGVAVNLALFVSLDSNSLIIGSTWAIIGAGFLAVRTKGFRADAPKLSGPEI